MPIVTLMSLSRNHLFCLSLVVFSFAILQLKCGAQNVPDNFDVQSKDEDSPMMIGTYVGMFGPHKITVSIEKVVGKTVMGYSIVTANERAFSGSWQRLPEGGFAIVAKEPGDHKEDGVFTLTIDFETRALKGYWESLKKPVEKVTLDLIAKKFKYDPKVGQYPQASKKLLKAADVENLLPNELQIMRNEIYARHGYSFINEEMQKHFAQVDWYMPIALDVKTSLTQIESKNAELIKRYEKYEAQYYDRFGR